MDDTNPPGGDEFQTALALGLLPIREVARSTGVNPVTLRAWERRYGLIVPHRTPKGHRLYSQEHVQRIQAILTWLNRGVSVSQVKGLLDNHPPSAPVGDNDWSVLRGSSLLAITRLSERLLDEGFNRALALYPPRTLCEHLLLPLLAELEQRWQGQFGAQLEQVFFYAWLRSKLGARIYHNNRQHVGAPLLLANLSGRPMEPGLWLCAWLASSCDCPVEVLDGSVPTDELRLALEILTPRALLVYSSQALDATQSRRHLPRLHDACRVPLLLAGPTVQVHRQELAHLNNLHFAAAPLDAQQVLLRLGVLAPQEGSPCAN